MENLQPPSREFTFRAPDQIRSTESTSTPTGLGTPRLPHDRSQLQHKLIRNYLSNPDSRHQVQLILVLSRLLYQPQPRASPALLPTTSPGPRPTFPSDACPPTFSRPSIVPEFHAAIARAEDIFNREIHAHKNSARARTKMTMLNPLW